jgi:hypothetical protein
MQSESPEKLPERNIKTLGDFFEYINNLEDDSGMRPIAFRGQANHVWQVKPSIMRYKNMIQNENKIIRDVVSLHTREFDNEFTTFDRLVRAQHFDIPTRLLDLTSNPLVALWFSCQKAPGTQGETDKDGIFYSYFIEEHKRCYYDSDRVTFISSMANLNENEKNEVRNIVEEYTGSNYSLSNVDKFNASPALSRLLFYVRGEKPHFQPNIKPGDLLHPIYVKPKMNNRRIIAQSGAFLLFGILKDTEICPGIKRNAIRIDALSKDKINEDLEKFGIHEGMLFPEIDRLSRMIKKRYDVTQ